MEVSVDFPGPPFDPPRDADADVPKLSDTFRYSAPRHTDCDELSLISCRGGEPSVRIGPCAASDCLAMFVDDTSSPLPDSPPMTAHMWSVTSLSRVPENERTLLARKIIPWLHQRIRRNRA